MNRLTVIFVAAALLFTSSVMPAAAAGAAAQAAPDWLEPNGLNIMDLVGFVPDSYLANATIFSATGFGLIQYLSGWRAGNQVMIHTRVYPVRVNDTVHGWQWAQFGCPAQPALGDAWGTVYPTMLVRVTADGQDVTRQITLGAYQQAGQIKPALGTNNGDNYGRYPLVEVNQPLTVYSSGWGLLPPNHGCRLSLGGLPSVMYADFQFSAPPKVSAAVISRQTFTFHTYIGPGQAGWLTGLQNQMRGAFGDRHDKFTMSIPYGADYVFVNYPQEKFDPYTGCPGSPELRDTNLDRLPASGTYRLINNDQLSVDHIVSMGLPVGGQWRDADLSGNVPYLPYIAHPTTLATPEYFLPSYMGYDACMTAGNCSRALLDEIHNATMTLTVTYLKVQRIAGGLTRIPLRQVGPTWTPGTGSPAGQASAAEALQPVPENPRPGYRFGLYLPIAQRDSNGLPSDDPAGCPCGWFDSDGQMVDFIPAP